MGASRQKGDRIAIISDVHGNLTALEAVLTHIKDAGITRIFNLGDLVGKGPRSAAVVDRCRDACEIVVQGNWDADTAKAGAPPHAVLDWHRDQLGEKRLTYLAALPGSFDFLLSGRRIRLFHASQAGVFHRVYETDAREQHRAMFNSTDFTGFGAARYRRIRRYPPRLRAEFRRPDVVQCRQRRQSAGCSRGLLRSPRWELQRGAGIFLVTAVRPRALRYRGGDRSSGGHWHARSGTLRQGIAHRHLSRTHVANRPNLAA